MYRCIIIFQTVLSLPDSPSIRQAMAPGVDGAFGCSGGAGMSGVWPPFTVHQLDEKRPHQADRRQNCTGVSYSVLTFRENFRTQAVHNIWQLSCFLFRQRNATLYIQSVRSYDEGVYVCEASNTLGQSHGTALLRVAGKF